MHSPAPCLSRIVIPARKQAAGSLPVSIRSIRPATGHLIRFWHFFSGRRNHNHPSWHLLKHLQPWGSGPPKTPSPEPTSANRRRLAPENRLRFAEAPAETPNPEPFFSDDPDSVCRGARSGKPTPRFRQNRGPECRNRGVGGCGLPESWRRRLRVVGTAARGTAGASAAGHDAHKRYVLLAPAATGRTIGTFRCPEAYRSCALSRKAPRKRTLRARCRSRRALGRRHPTRAERRRTWIRMSGALTSSPNAAARQPSPGERGPRRSGRLRAPHVGGPEAWRSGVGRRIRR